jgi:hypothetical protein
MQYIEKNSWTLICWSKIMFIIIFCSKKSPYEVVVQWLKIWLLNVEAKSSNPHTCNLNHFGYLDIVIRLLRMQTLLDHLT